MKRPAARFALAIAAACLAMPAAAASDVPSSIEDLRFASQLGSPAGGAPPAGPSSQRPGAADFAGAGTAACSGMDLHTFLQAFDPHELLNELRLSLISGAQSAVSNYLLALAYSAPTLTSVLDMTDRTLNTRFTAFARSCALQRADAADAAGATRRLAQASQQCFSSEIARGAAPTDAMRRCASARQFDGLGLPASLPNVEFMRRYTLPPLNARLQSLLALLPDARIQDGSYQVRPPQLTVASLADGWQLQARTAMDLIDAGAEPSRIPACSPDPASAGGASGCLPPAALAIVNSPAYRATRLLEPAARSIFKDALAGQMAAVQVYSDLLELGQRISAMGLRTDGDAPAEEILSRQRSLQQEAAQLLGQADLRIKLQESKAALARLQLLALQRAQADLQSRASSLDAEQRAPGFGLHDLLRVFMDRD